VHPLVYLTKLNIEMNMGYVPLTGNGSGAQKTSSCHQPEGGLGPTAAEEEEVMVVVRCLT
jgi:hypothetical protein